MPSASDLPGAKLTARLITYDSNADASTAVTLSPDTDKPTLNTTSTPPKGTKVKPGDTIKIRLEASEEYSQDRVGWQTGVKKLQLIDESPKPVVTPHWESTQMGACAAKQWKHWLEVTYTVPPNPPPIIRLRAIADDFAGNQDFDVAEFPTRDWYGTLTSEMRFRAATGETIIEKANVTLTLDDKGGGNLTGEFDGTGVKEGDTNGCTHTTTRPAVLKGTLVGLQSGQNTITLQVDKMEVTQGTENIRCNLFGQVVISEVPVLGDAPYFLHERVFSHVSDRGLAVKGLKATGSGVFESTFEELYGSIGTLRVTVKLQRAPK